jgi:hypothetical protein
MPSVKAKISVRDLGKEGKKGLDQKALKKVRGGTMITLTAAKRPKPEGCDHAGQHCDMLHVSTMAKGTILTVVVDGRPKY